MRMSSARFGGLGTRVAARTFALFCLCAIVPIVVSALIADRMVKTKLRNDAAIRLESTSKNYGLLVFERLRQTDEALAGIAALGLADRLPLDDIRAFRSIHFKVVDAVAGAAIADEPDRRRGVGGGMIGARIHRAIVKPGVRDVARMNVSRHLSGRLAANVLPSRSANRFKRPRRQRIARSAITPQRLSDPSIHEPVSEQGA